MSTIANPNWLAITAAFFVVSGIGILARAALCQAPEGATEEQRTVAGNRRALNTNIGGGTLALGAFMHIASQMSAPSLSFMTVVFALSLAFGLILYACMEHSLAESLFPAKEAPRQPAPRLQLIAPPTAEPREAPVASARAMEAAAMP